MADVDNGDMKMNIDYSLEHLVHQNVTDEVVLVYYYLHVMRRLEGKESGRKYLVAVAHQSS